MWWGSNRPPRARSQGAPLAEERRTPPGIRQSSDLRERTGKDGRPVIQGRIRAGENVHLGAGLCPRTALGTGQPLRASVPWPVVKETAPKVAGQEGLVWVPRRGDFLQGRDFMIPVKGLGWGWGGASEHFSVQVLCTHLPGLESGRGLPRRAEASGRREPSSTLWPLTQLPGGGPAAPEGAGGLGNAPNKDFTHKFTDTFASSSLSPFQTVPSEEKSPVWKLAQVPPRTMAVCQLLKAPPSTFPHCSREAFNRTKYQNRMLWRLCSTFNK